MNCKNCGTKIIENAKFCKKCGKSVDNNVAGIANTEKNNAEVVESRKDNPKNKWYCKPWWLISLGILILFVILDINSSSSISESYQRLIIIIFIATLLFFVIWLRVLLFSRLKREHSCVVFIVFVLITTVIFIAIYYSLSWVKCGRYQGYINCNLFDKGKTPEPTGERFIPKSLKDKI